MDWHCPHPEDDESHVNFSCPLLNEKLGPAFRPGNLIELFGEAGSAKTQFCLHLALQSVRRGSGIVLYIATERPFATKRIYQMIRYSGLNEDLLDRAGSVPVGFTIIQRQLFIFCKIMRYN